MTHPYPPDGGSRTPSRLPGGGLSFEQQALLRPKLPPNRGD